MVLWISVVVSLVVMSTLTSGLPSAILDFIAFLILLIVGVRRATGKAIAPSCRASKSSASQSSQ